MNKMDLQELEKWIVTDEGIKWLEAQKKGLVDKNNELLEKLKTANGELETANGTIQKLEGDLLKEQGINKEVLLSRPLAEKLKAKGIFEVLVPEISKTISEAYGLHIAEGNAKGKVSENGKEKVLTLDQVVDSWAKLETSKDCFKPQDVETQSTSPDFKQGGKPAADREMDAAYRAAGIPKPKE